MSDPPCMIAPNVCYLSRPGEELAASGFVAIVFYLFVDINLRIYRIFKRK